jgi:type IV pilus assembly protein PilB
MPKTDILKCPFTDLARCLLQVEPVASEKFAAILGSSLRKTCDVINAQAMLLLILDAGGKMAHFQNVYFSPSLYGPDEAKRHSFQEKAKALLVSAVRCCGTCAMWGQIRKGLTVQFPSAEAGRECFEHVCELTGVPVSSFVALPLRTHGTVVGCLEVVNKMSGGGVADSFPPEDLRLLDDLAESASLVMGRVMEPARPLNDKVVAQLLARITHRTYVPLGRDFKPDFTLLRQIGEERLERQGVIPMDAVGPTGMRVAVVDPFDQHVVEDFETRSGFHVVEIVVTSRPEIHAVLNRTSSRSGEIAAVTESFMRDSEVEAPKGNGVLMAEQDEKSGPIIELTNQLIQEARAHRASDIHIEPQEKRLLVRYRIDGVCRTKHTFPREVHAPLVSRIKIMSDLDIAERRMPQDGRVNVAHYIPDLDLDLRVSIIPSNHGESIVLRLLDKQRSTLPLDQLGFSPVNLVAYRKLILNPYGMVLHCGPTGSGKSMTLYAALNEINSPDLKIVTVEDPIEYTLPGIIQVQVNKDIDLTFAACLRSFLRHDPDIILVGEIRDRETAQVAIEAALSGHLLFSTLHTNDAPSTLPRLSEMGVEPFLVSSTLVAVCAQRLIRRLCNCRKLKACTDDEAKLFGFRHGGPPRQLWVPGQCDECEDSGYKGRTGIHELLVMNDELRTLTSRVAPGEAVKAAARRAGMTTMFEDAMEKVALGASSLPEALSIVSVD